MARDAGRRVVLTSSIDRVDEGERMACTVAWVPCLQHSIGIPSCQRLVSVHRSASACDIISNWESLVLSYKGKSSFEEELLISFSTGSRDSSLLIQRLPVSD
jgi:hypothetical protein